MRPLCIINRLLGIYFYIFILCYALREEFVKYFYTEGI